MSGVIELIARDKYKYALEQNVFFYSQMDRTSHLLLSYSFHPIIQISQFLSRHN